MKLEIIGRKSCKYCENAKILAFDSGIGFEYKTLDEDVSRETIVDEIGKEFRTVPQIFAIKDDGTREYVGGYTELTEYLSRRKGE